MTLPTNPVDAVARLTLKERECLSRWLGHATAKEIALELGVSHHAVEKRLKSARQKLGVATSLEAARVLAEAEDYGRTASQPAEVDYPSSGDHQEPVGGAVASQSLSLRRRLWIIGATIMSLTLFAALALTTLASQATERPPEVRVIDRTKGDPAAQIAAAADASFARLDKDGSGFLEGSELSGATVHTARVARGNEAMQLSAAADLAQADSDKDGRVSRVEHRDWLSGLVARSRS